MIYLYLDKNNIKLLALSKTLLGQYAALYFEKTHTSDLLENGGVKNVDVAASAIKEAITGAKPEAIKDTDVYLILPQQAFTFARYSVPADIQPGAVAPFIKDKVRADFPFDIDAVFSDFLVVQQQNESTVLLYILKPEVLERYDETMRLLGLNIKAVAPDTVAYYKLFEKTLKKEKRENIIYARFQEPESHGYVFDSLGLLEASELTFSQPIEQSLKETAEKYEDKQIKIDRIILSGEKAAGVRQDTFTKDVGVWTNPLDKIVTNFYADYLKLLVPADKSSLPYLSLDPCLGGFILHSENPDFSLLKKAPSGAQTGSGLSNFKLSLPNLPVNWRDVAIFLTSMVVTFAIIFMIQRFGKKINLPLANKPVPTAIPVVKPTAAPAPSPKVNREEVKIKVLNGSGIKGKAVDIQNLLKDKGYVDVLTGNADNFDYETTVIQVKEDKKYLADIIKKDLADEVKIDKVTTLDKKETADVIIILGTDIGSQTTTESSSAASTNP